jgi:hypothetical protein
MAGPLTLVILVAAGQGGDASTEGVLRAAREGLGANARLVIREAPGSPTEADALDIESSTPSDAVAEVRWTNARRDRASLLVLVPRTGRWVYRAIRFAASDAPLERGRTLGFAVVSMLPEGGLTPPDRAPSPQAPESTPSAAPVAQPSGAVPATLPSPPTAAVIGQEEVDEKPPPPTQVPGELRQQPRLAIDIVGIGAIGLGGSADGIGAAAAAQWFALPALSLRLGGGGLAGSLPSADANTSYFLGEAGVALHPLRARPGRPFGIAFRVDCVVMRQSASRLGPGSSPASYERWLPGAAATLDADYLFAPEVELVLGLGIVDVFGPTHVSVQGVPVATIPPLRAVPDAGFRLRF